MAGLLGNYEDPRGGLLGGDWSSFGDRIMNPMTLSGLALLSGGGFGGAMEGLRMGAGFQDQKRKRMLEDQERQAYQGLLADPNLGSNLPKGFAPLLAAAGPERGYPLLAKYADPDRSLDLELQRANLAKTKAETNALNQKDAMSGFIMGLLGGGEPDAAQPGATAPMAPNGAPPAVMPQSMPSGAGVPRTGLLPISNEADELPGIWGNPTDLTTATPGATPARDIETVKNIPPSRYSAPDAPSWFQNAQFVPVQDAGTPAPPEPASPPVSGGDDLVQTPSGIMTRSRARQIGAAMSMDPRYGVLAKEFFDAARTVGPGMNKPALNAIQEKQFNTVEQFSRLKSIEQSWKPEYQQIENRLGFAWNNLLDKFGTTRKTLTKQQRDELVAFHASRSEALNNLNQYIKEITGAAMTLPEAERIKRTMPNPGEGAFDGDGPTEFYAKLQANIRVSKMALARYNYLSKRGFPADVEAMSREISLDAMPKVIQDRTNDLLKESLNANPGLTPQDVAPIVRQRLRAEFGIDA